MVKVLIINADESFRAIMATYLKRRSFSVFVTGSIDEAWDIFLKEKPMTCMIDPFGIKDYPPMSWNDFIRKGKEIDSVSRFWVSTFLDDSLAEEAKKAGADEIVFNVMLAGNELADKLSGRA